MSLVPGSVELWLVRKILDLTSDDVVDNCVSRGLGLFDDAGSFLFRHELARLATLARIAPRKQKQLNAQILAIMKQAVSPFSVSRLMHHAAAANDKVTVLELAPQANGDDEITAGEMIEPVDVAVCPPDSPNPFAGHVYIAGPRP